MFSIFLYIILCNWIFALHEANHLFIYLLSPTTLPIIEWFLSFSRIRKKRSSQLSIRIWFFPLENNNNVMNDENSLMFENLFFTQTKEKSGSQKIIVYLDFFFSRKMLELNIEISFIIVWIWIYCVVAIVCCLVWHYLDCNKSLHWNLIMSDVVAWLRIEIMDPG